MWPFESIELAWNEHQSDGGKRPWKNRRRKIFDEIFSPLFVSSSMNDQVSETKRLKKLHDAVMLIIASGHTTFIFWLIQQQILIKRKYWLDLFNNQLQLCWALSPVFFILSLLIPFFWFKAEIVPPTIRWNRFSYCFPSPFDWQSKL